MTRLIGLNGFKRSGKDTTYEMIADALKVAIPYRIGLADHLKLLTAEALGFDRSPLEAIQLMDSIKEDANIRVEYTEPDSGLVTIHEIDGRAILRNIGHGVRTRLGEDTWLNLVLPPRFAPGVADYDPKLELEVMYPFVDVLVVTDIRYQNEAEHVVALGGEVWNIQNPRTQSDGQVSEQPLPEGLITRVIDNSGDFDHLRTEVLKALNARE